jgi:tRNA (cmo5U34)-methyltransferase
MPSERPKHFDATNAASYDERWAPLLPLRDSLHLQIGLLLQDLAAEARVLCVGAGTGAELLALARLFPTWHFVALDPSEPMLTICRQRAEAGGIVSRCEFHAGYVDDLPDRQEFHAATSLLVSHFLIEPAQRAQTPA